MREKLRSKVVWLTALPLIAELIAVYSVGVSEQFLQVATPIVTLLALFGILNNPDTRDKF